MTKESLVKTEETNFSCSVSVSITDCLFANFGQKSSVIITKQNSNEKIEDIGRITGKNKMELTVDHQLHRRSSPGMFWQQSAGLQQSVYDFKEANLTSDIK